MNFGKVRNTSRITFFNYIVANEQPTKRRFSEARKPLNSIEHSTFPANIPKKRLTSTSLQSKSQGQVTEKHRRLNFPKCRNWVHSQPLATEEKRRKENTQFPGAKLSRDKSHRDNPHAITRTDYRNNRG